MNNASWANDTVGEGWYGPEDLTLVESLIWYVLYAIICLCAVGGNTAVVVIICINPHMRTTTSMLIANLAIADGLSGAFGIPFRFIAALTQRWMFPSALCQVVPMVESVTLSVSVFTLTASAVDRLRGVVSSAPPLKYSTISLTIIFIWLFSICSSVPYGVYHQVALFNPETGIVLNFTDEMLNDSAYTRICFPVAAPPGSTANWWTYYNMYLTVITYFVPVVVINLAYMIVMYNVWVADIPVVGDEYTRFEEQKRKVVKMLVIVVMAFTFCWLPYELYLVLSEFFPSINSYAHIKRIFFCLHWLAMGNSCLNPIIYYLYNNKYRREYRMLALRLVPANLRPTAVRKRSYMGSARGKTLKELGHAMSQASIPTLHSDRSLERAARRSTCARLYVAAELGYDIHHILPAPALLANVGTNENGVSTPVSPSPRSHSRSPRDSKGSKGSRVLFDNNNDDDKD